MRKRVQAAMTIQAFWRGCQLRLSQKIIFRKLRLRVRAANANVQEHMKIGNRARSALDILLGSKQLSFVLDACTNLGMYNQGQ